MIKLKKNLSKHAKRQLFPVYRSCEMLPLWNFFKIVETSDLRYLVRLDDRFDYDILEYKKSVEHSSIWDAIVDEYATLENSSNVQRQNFTKSKLYLEWARYTEERAMIQYLMISKDDMGFIVRLRQRGYKIATDSNVNYWNSLAEAANKVHYHVTFLDLYTKEINRDLNVDEVKDKNSFDIVMATLNSYEGIRANDDITVSRYIAFKKIITDRNKAHEKANSKRHGARA